LHTQKKAKEVLEDKVQDVLEFRWNWLGW